MNDDRYAANRVLGTGARTVRGEIGTRCDIDVFAFDVPLNGNVEVTLTARSPSACAGAPAVELTLLVPACTTEVASATPAPCPSLTTRVTAAGTYVLQVYAPNNDAERVFTYDLAINVTP